MEVLIIIFFLFHYSTCIGETWHIGISDKGLNFLMEREGFITGINNPEDNIITIGYGFTSAYEPIIGVKINELKNISKEAGKLILENIIHKKYESLINKYDIMYCFKQNQYNALILFAYNYGEIDELSNYGKRIIKEISDNFISEEFMNVEGIKSIDLENRRKL